MKKLITILGPTASGKTALAVQVAYKVDGEIISADSRQVYRQMDIGTGKDLDEYTIHGQTIPYHLIDIYYPGYKYNIYEFQQDFWRIYSEMQVQHKQPILCGGSGLYIETILKGYEMITVPVNKKLREQLTDKSQEELNTLLQSYKSLHNTTDTETRRRTIRAIEIADFYAQHEENKQAKSPVPSIIIGIDIDREIRRSRITQRLHARLSEGMVEEVQQLLDHGIAPDTLIYYGLEYKYLTLYLTGELTYNSMVKQLNIAIHQFAKRQMTWFRGMERRGLTIHWIDGTLPMPQRIEKVLAVISIQK